METRKASPAGCTWVGGQEAPPPTAPSFLSGSLPLCFPSQAGCSGLSLVAEGPVAGRPA